MRIEAKIEIDGPPELVKEVLLDFKRFPEWTQSLVTSIWQMEEKPSIEVGDKLAFVLEGQERTVVVTENSEQLFSWRGGVPLLIYGDHGFRFEPGNEPGSTTLTHFEEFTGMIGSWALHIPAVNRLPKRFADFNEDLKKRVESLSKGPE